MITVLANKLLICTPYSVIKTLTKLSHISKHPRQWDNNIKNVFPFCSPVQSRFLSPAFQVLLFFILYLQWVLDLCLLHHFMVLSQTENKYALELIDQVKKNSPQRVIMDQLCVHALAKHTTFINIHGNTLTSTTIKEPPDTLTVFAGNTATGNDTTERVWAFLKANKEHSQETTRKAVMEKYLLETEGKGTEGRDGWKEMKWEIIKVMNNSSLVINPAIRFFSYLDTFYIATIRQQI